MRRRIAVIDDDPDILTMLESVLIPEGYDVLCYTRGEGAYEWIKREQPDLVILDLWIETPDMGYVVLGLLGKDPATQSIPVIVFSSYLRSLKVEAVLPAEQRVIALEKPATLNQILSLVAQLLPQTQMPGMDITVQYPDEMGL